MGNLTLHVLGGFEAGLDGRALGGFESDKTRALLAYLAMETGGPHRREKLAGLFWPERSEESARANLRQALTNLRTVLGERTSEEGLLETSRQSVRLGSGSRLWVDATALCHLAEPPTGAAPSSAQVVSRLEEAVQLYRGEFLEGLSLGDAAPAEDWVRRCRELCQRKVVEALRLLADSCESAGQLGEALSYTWRQVAMAPWSEEAHRRAMRLLASSGRRGAALAQFEACRRALAEELGSEPEAETLHLRETIRSGRLGPGRPAASEPAAAAASPAVSLDVGVPHRASTPPLVGRERELARLDRILRQTLGGDGGVALVSGEAGSGKTFLMTRFSLLAQQAHPELVMAAAGGTAYTGSGDPYHPFREILNLLAGDVELGWRTGALTSEQAARLTDLAPSTCEALLEEGPQLVDSLVAAKTLLERVAALTPDGRGWSGRLRALLAANAVGPDGPVAHPSALFEQYARVLAWLAARRPLLLLLDDLQWADSGTLNLLFHVARRLTGSRVLVLAAYRAESVVTETGAERPSLAGLVNELARGRGNLTIDLGCTAGQAFVEALLDSEPNRLGRAFRETLLRQTGGHPLFTVELLRGMRERDELVRDPEGQWVESRSLDWTELPARVEAVIAERVCQLPDELLTLLGRASVQGDTFSAEIVARIGGEDRRRVLRTVSEELERRRQLVSFVRVRQLGRERLSEFRFRHCLFQTYLYRSLGRAERAQLHAEVGAELERLHQNQPEAPATSSQLAWHFGESGQVLKAIHYRRVAAEDAMRVSAYQQAIDNLRPALALVGRIPDEADQARQELALQTLLGAALTAVRGFADHETGAAYARALDLCDTVREVPLLYQSLRGAVGFHLVGGAPLKARVLGEQLVALSETTADPSVALEAHHVLGTTLFHLAEFSSARRHLERATALYDVGRDAGHLWMFGFDPGVSSRVYLGLCLLQAGHPIDALRTMRAGVRLAHRIAHPFSRCYVLLVLSLFHLELGFPRKARRWVERGSVLATQHAFPHWLAWSNVLQGRLAAELDDADAGIPQIREGLKIHRAIDSKVSLPTELGLLAEACLILRRTDEGLAAVEEAFAQIGASEERWWSAELHRLRGELLVASGADDAEAERSFEQAIATARQQGTRLWEYRATLGLCRLWVGQGRHETSRERLETACRWLADDFDTPYRREAEALLRRLRRMATGSPPPE